MKSNLENKTIYFDESSDKRSSYVSKVLSDNNFFGKSVKENTEISSPFLSLKSLNIKDHLSPSTDSQKSYDILIWVKNFFFLYIFSLCYFIYYKHL